MEDVPEHLNLSRLMGTELSCIDLSEFQIQFWFGSGWTIDVPVDSRWELLDASGAVLDRSQAHKERATYQLHRLLGQEPQSWTVDPPKSFSLTFGNALVLRVYADDTESDSGVGRIRPPSPLAAAWQEDA